MSRLRRKGGVGHVLCLYPLVRVWGAVVVRTLLFLASIATLQLIFSVVLSRF